MVSCNLALFCYPAVQGCILMCSHRNLHWGWMQTGRNLRALDPLQAQWWQSLLRGSSHQLVSTHSIEAVPELWQQYPRSYMNELLACRHV